MSSNASLDSDVASLWRSLAGSPAQPALWFQLARLYHEGGLPWQTAYAAQQAVRLHPALKPRIAAALGGCNIRAGDELLGRSMLAEARERAARFAAWIDECPGDWLTWLYLARLQEIGSQPNAREPDPEPAQCPAPANLALAKARALEPIVGESMHWLGVWRLNAGDAAAAVEALSCLVDVRPVRCGSMMFLGEALLRTGRIAAAEKAFARASLSDNPEFLLKLALSVYPHNYWREAIAVLQKALAIRPRNVATLLTLARIQSEVYALDGCRQTLSRIRALEPDNAEARLLDAALQGRLGHADDHLARLQAIYQAGGDPQSRLLSSIAMTSLYSTTLSPAEVAVLHRRLCAPIEAGRERCTAFADARGSDRPLRIGFVTGDLHRQHPVNLFMLPVLQHLDHARFDVFVYYTGSSYDDYTRRAQACTNGWREAATMDDPALQQAILSDRIHILIDLAGHTSSHRLGVFAMGAAPVQATFLGYPHSTGLAAIDWLIGDPIVSPESHSMLFTERLALLPCSVFCWAPVDDYPLPPPRPAGAPVVFGSFNNAMKLSETTLTLWSRVMDAVPKARLLLKAPSFSDAEVRAQFARRFVALGVAAERLEFRGPSGLGTMMQEYGDIDIALDPTPYNGGTTTLQALWMGVPIVTLAGGNFAGRMGASFLATLDRNEWIAGDEPAYVAAAVSLAESCACVRRGRAALREDLAASPLGDIAAYTEHFQALLTRIWQAHLEGNDARVIGVADARM